MCWIGLWIGCSVGLYGLMALGGLTVYGALNFNWDGLGTCNAAFLSFKPAPRVSKVRCLKGFGVFLDLKLFWF